MKSSPIFIAMLCLMPFAAWAGDGVGSLKELTGTVHVTHKAANQTTPQDMKLGDPVFEHDIVETDDGARAVFHFADDAELVVTGKGKLVVDKYIYDAAKKDGNGAVFSILGSAFSYVGGLLEKDKSGLLGVGEKPVVKLNMNYGNIGIRGTKVWGALRNGLDWVYLQEGAANVDNKGGSVALNPGYGTRLSAESETPAPAYKWGDTEIAWIKRLADDPSAHEMQSMASNISPRQLKEPEDASEKKDSAPGGPSGGSANSNALDSLAPKDEEEIMGGKAAPAAPAASAPAPVIEAVPQRAREAEESADAKVKAQKQISPMSPWERLNAPLWGSVLTEKDGVLYVNADGPATVHVAEAPLPIKNYNGEAIRFFTDIKALEISGRASLEIYVHIRDKKGGGWYPATGPNEITKPADWLPYGAEAKPPFYEKNQVVDKAALDLVIQGKAKLMVKNARLHQ